MRPCLFRAPRGTKGMHIAWRVASGELARGGDRGRETCPDYLLHRASDIRVVAGKSSPDS
jgi:hypothetical protein